MSDLHLEKNGYDTLTIPRAAPYLLVVGDIGVFRQESLFLSFLRLQCETFDLVLLVLGNHEFYGVSREQGLEIAKRFEDELDGKLIILNRRRIDLPDGRTVVLGCTLHSHIPPGYTALTNDFLNIQSWTVAKHNDEHVKDLSWLKDTLSLISNSNSNEHPHSNKRIIIATHYAPSYTQTCHPSEENSALSHCFCSNSLDDLATRKGIEMVFAWLSGHTHFNYGFKQHGVWCASNHLEGRHQRRAFNMEAVI